MKSHLPMCSILVFGLFVPTSAFTQGQQSDLGMLTDGQLHVVMCGTGSPLTDANRASACVAVVAGGEVILVDTGPGSWRQVALNRVPAKDVSAILLTHFHSDHIGDLGEAITQSWLAGRAKPLEVYGPHGVERVVAGFAQAYGLDVDYRIAHHTEQVLRSCFLPRFPSAVGTVEKHAVRFSTVSSSDTCDTPSRSVQRTTPS